MSPLLGRLRKHLPETSKFATVGALAFIVDISVFNILLFASIHLLGTPKPLAAKTISILIATLVAFLGNKKWTYSARVGGKTSREAVLFLVVNGIAILATLGCLGISHYLLGLDSPVADNISANIVGTAVGTVFRFYAYRTWVFVNRSTVTAQL